jgi:hypothetical protein
MMEEHRTDKLLGELFKRNAPSVNEPTLRERISARLSRRRRRSRRNRTVRAIALGFACIVLAGAAAFGVHTVVDHSQSQSQFVFTDVAPVPGDSSSGYGTASGPLLARVSPVMGTAALEQVKSEGTRDPGSGVGGTDRVRGRVEVYRLSMSQPALDGTMEITTSLATRRDGNTDVEGSWVLRTSQGDWECSFWKGTLLANRVEQFYFGTASGTGGFEGLTLLLQWHVVKDAGSPATAEPSSQPIAVSGWIQSAK